MEIGTYGKKKNIRKGRKLYTSQKRVLSFKKQIMAREFAVPARDLGTCIKFTR